MKPREKNSLFSLVFDSDDYSNIKRKNFFITGGTGYLGRWFIKSLDYLNLKKNLNISIYLLTRKKKNFLLLKKSIKNINIYPVIGDINNFTFPKARIDHIFHLAAETSLEKKENINDICKTVINETIRIVELCKLSQSESLTYLSSGGVYGKNCLCKKGWRENQNISPPINQPGSAYGLAKKHAENILINYFKEGQNIKTLNIFRPFSFGGSNFNKKNHYAYDDFIKKRISQKSITLNSNGKSIRNYMHPIDLSSWMLSGIKFKGKNIINTGANKNYSLEKLAIIIAKYKYKNLCPVKIKLGKIDNNENYIPNLKESFLKGLVAKITLEMQIEDSFEFYK